MIYRRINPISSNKRELKNIKQMIEDANGLMKNSNGKMSHFIMKDTLQFYKYLVDIIK